MSKDRPNRAYATELAIRAQSAQRPLDWFESFYAQSGGNADFIPWADLEPNPNLVEWMERCEVRYDCERAMLVVGCGLGDDAAYLAKSGSRVTAFDISATAIEWARRRFDGREHDLHFMQANLLALPSQFESAFNLVVEIYTLQVLPEALRQGALAALARCVSANDGRLLIICRGRDDGEPFGELPWGVSKAELRFLESVGLKEVEFDDYVDPHTASRRFRAVYSRE